jgi:hypothetical protein
MPALILMGAGASFGSGDVQPCCPPLGNGPDGLFARLEEAGGQASSLPTDLRTLFRTDFEKGMAQFYEFADGDIMRFQREVASYLAAFRPGKGNAYVRLIRTIGPRRAIYSSLNYDLLFELAAGSLGLNTLYGTDPVAKGVRLLKLHGSCARRSTPTLDLTMRRLLAEALVPLSLMAALISAGFWLRAPDLAMLGLLAPGPLFLVIAVRRHLSLLRKLAYAGPLPVLGPALLYFVWTYQSPGRPMYFLVGAVAGAVFLVGMFAFTRVLWEVR